MTETAYLINTRAKIIGKPGVSKERPAFSLVTARKLAENINVGRNEHSVFTVVEMGERPFVANEEELEDEA